MKKLFLLLIFLCANLMIVQAQSIALPKECGRLLNKNFRGWKLARIQKEVNAYHRQKKFPFAPNLIRGDWNGDGRMDYAVLIVQGKLENAAGEDIDDRRLLIAFVKSRKGFKYFQFDGSDFIQLMKKGAKDYDYDAAKDFRYKTDAIFSGIWEKAGVSYIWKKGKFVEIITSD